MKLLKFLPLLFLLVACDSTSACPPGNTCIANNDTQAINNAAQLSRNESRDYGLYGPVSSVYGGGTMQKIGFIGKCDIYRLYLYEEHIITMCPKQKSTDVQNIIHQGKRYIPSNDVQVQ